MEIFMIKNMGNIDRTLRVIVALLLVILYFANVVTGTFGVILLIVAVVFLLTSSISFCPLYAILGLNSGKKK
jgi:uncharacterized membrane protein